MQEPKLVKPQFYRYAGLIVKVAGDRISAVTVRPDGRARFFNPLPRRYRRIVQADARKREQAFRLERLNVTRKPRDVWTDLSQPTAVA